MQPASKQPAAPFAQLDAILAHHGCSQDQLLPVLHAIQDAAGYIPPDMVGDIAAAFNLSRAEVHGVITFYHYFRSEAPARHVVQLCRAEACQSMGGDALLAHAERVTGCKLHVHGGPGAQEHCAHGAAGDVALEPVYCLGQCATAPAMMINDKLHARVTPARFDALLARAKEAV
jgi:formate dehydrogenase subunit gamma